MDVSAKIKGISYTPYLNNTLGKFSLEDLEKALTKSSSFLLDINDKCTFAVSWWVSAKRTRSYPYARVYDTLGCQEKKITIIPIIKDEGKEGDRDFLQWDTISLMSLLGVYTIISYYNNAERSSRYSQKITNQRFDIDHLKSEIGKLLSYHSGALEWNIEQADKVAVISTEALNSYEAISKKLNVEMHSKESAENRISELEKGRENFKNLSRELAKNAQNRESKTVQPKEKLSGIKAKLTIKNYIGGLYYFTADEIHIKKNSLYLVEGKHSKNSLIPSLEDIKDGLLKMILFTNLEDVKIGRKKYSPIAVLKLTSGIKFCKTLLSKSQLKQLQLLKNESKTNNFHVKLNGTDLKKLNL